MWILHARTIEEPILPVARLRFAISESVHTKPLPPSFVPGTFILMSIRKPIDPKTMHLVCEILPSIGVPISELKKKRPATRISGHLQKLKKEKKIAIGISLFCTMIRTRI